MCRMDTNRSSFAKYVRFGNQTDFEEHCHLLHIGTYIGLVLIALFIIVGSTGNSVVIVVLIRTRRILTSRVAPATINYVISLASSDLLTCLTVLPFDIIYWLNFPRWPLTQRLCKLWNALFYTFHAAASFSIVAISLDTYKTVSNPFNESQNKCKCNSKIVIFFTWLWSFAVGTLIYFFQEEPPKGRYLFELDPIAYGLYLLIHLIIPQIIAAVCYFRLFQIAKLHAVSIKNRSITAVSTNSTESTSSQALSFKEEFKLARTFLLITIGYFMLWSPFFSVQLIYVFQQEANVNWCALETADTVVCWVAYFQCCLNSFIYALRKKYFQDMLRRQVRPI